MNVMCPLVCVHSFQVHHVPYDTVPYTAQQRILDYTSTARLVLINDPIATQHVPSFPGDRESLPAVISLTHRYDVTMQLTEQRSGLLYRCPKRTLYSSLS